MSNWIQASTRRTGIAAMSAGTLFSAWIAAGLARDVQDDGGKIVDLPLYTAGVVIYGAGMLALAVAFLGLGALPLPGVGRAGAWTGLVGALLHTLFSTQLVVWAVRTREQPETFALFGLGFLLLVAGQLLLAVALRRTGSLGLAWALSLLAAAGAVLAMVTVGLYHELGFLIFGAAWIALGARLLIHRSAPWVAAA